MSDGAGDFLERVNDFLKSRLEKRFAKKPDSEEVEHRLASCEALCEALARLVTDFIYDLSWLEENQRRHTALDEKGRQRLLYLQRRCKELANMLVTGSEDDEGPAPAGEVAQPQG